MKTIQDAARIAIECQDACNLSGVLYAYKQAMDIICTEANANNKGTDWKNKHPINILFIDKLAHLSGYSQSFGTTLNQLFNIIGRCSLPECSIFPFTYVLPSCLKPICA